MIHLNLFPLFFSVINVYLHIKLCLKGYFKFKEKVIISNLIGKKSKEIMEALENRMVCEPLYYFITVLYETKEGSGNYDNTDIYEIIISEFIKDYKKLKERYKVNSQFDGEYEKFYESKINYLKNYDLEGGFKELAGYDFQNEIAKEIHSFKMGIEMKPSSSEDGYTCESLTDGYWKFELGDQHKEYKKEYLLLGHNVKNDNDYDSKKLTYDNLICESQLEK